MSKDATWDKNALKKHAMGPAQIRGLWSAEGTKGLFSRKERR